jgi:hypothetical protein
MTMRPSDLKPFSVLLSDVMAYYGKDVSSFTQDLFWNACRGVDFEQVRRAFEAHAKDPESGRFPPKVADLVKHLQGTQTDRALIAWGKVAAALSDVGAYTDVVFDDPLIHLCIVDHGGWPKFCRTPFDEQSYLQHRFCESYRAYAARGAPSEYPARLTGAGSGADDFAKVGMAPPKPRLVGNRELALQVLAGGAAVQRLAAVPALAALPPPMHGEAA